MKNILILVIVCIFMASCVGSPIFVVATPGNTPPANPGSSPTAPVAATNSSIQSSTGFYWPTDIGDPKAYNNWLAANCSWVKDKNYQTINKIDYYHIGMDILGAVNDRVYAIADGTVIRISRNNLDDSKTKATVEAGGDPAGWGIGNVAILVDHQLVDGSHFVAVYGHIKDDPNNKFLTGESKTVHGHDLLGLIGPYPTGTHLHLGIYPIQPGGPKSPPAPLGRMVCPKTAPIQDTNGFTNPYEWLITQTPKNGLGTFSASTAQAPTTQPPTQTSSGQAFTIGIDTCTRIQDEVMIGIGTFATRISPGWKGYACSMWIQADQNWMIAGGDINYFDLPMGGTADFSQLAPYQQGNLYVMTSSNVKYPADLETPEYGYENVSPIFPGVAVAGRFFESWGSISLIKRVFYFMIPEAKTANYIVYTPTNQQINVPAEGQIAARPAVQGNFITQLPFSTQIDHYLSVEVSKPSLTKYENGISFSVTVSATNSDTTASHDVNFPVAVVDSNGIFWTQYNCAFSLGPSQSGENQCVIGNALYSPDQLPSAIYLEIYGSGKPNYLKLTIDQIAH